MKRTAVQAQAAAIPFRRSAHGIEVLLVTRTGGGWGIPKGGVKKGQSAREAAAMECLEEAGILGSVGTKLGSFTYRKGGRKRQVAVYALEVERVLDRWLEDGQRLRVWVPIAEAERMVRRKETPRFLTKLRHRLLTAGVPARLAA
ncbi:MAG TPA: NUDIX hydrolase [Planctomycetes bacterium]|nr:NUDIX hydrolase [Planctomycetota bacterium]|tara:strand:+ start:343 stop:777 length:435 start_codon:yes stop_codon:yes gene_type:complete